MEFEEDCGKTRERGEGRECQCVRDDPERSRAIKRRIHEKVEDYESYSFSKAETRLLNVFFDLAQEFNGEEDFYTICVSLPKVFFNLECNLFLVRAGRKLKLKRCTPRAETTGVVAEADDIPLDPEIRGEHYLIPIRGNPQLVEVLPFDPVDNILGCFDIHPAANLTRNERFFLGKYSNRIGYQIHNRFIWEKNREHIGFIRNLVDDIGHNVIVPNMYFKLFFNRMQGKIDGLARLSREMGESLAAGRNDCADFKEKLDYLYEGLSTQFGEICRHYEQTSLFLETLLRRRHFEEGRYVLEKRLVNLRTQVVEPQVERFRPRFEDKGIEIDLSLGGLPPEDILVMADVGLISQVYANLFSNAVKYTREIPCADGSRRKFMAYGWSVEPNYFGEGVDGVKLNVFTSGEPLRGENSDRLFEAGFRGGNVHSEYGTGHGLYFVEQVVALHGGVAGHEATPDGNNFYFILPRDAADPQG